MNTAFIKTVNWAKSLLIMALLSSTLSFSIMAQDKLMDARSRAALVTELKGVVSRTETDPKKAAMVAQKWDARKDLADKTKTQVINLLYEDVKSVIADPGTQYQISSMFSMYKQMPDESFSGQTKTQAGADSKPQAVSRLVDLTFASHPYVGIDDEVEKLPGTKSEKEIAEMKEADSKQRFEVFEDALKVNNKLTADQKTFVRANYDQLNQRVNKIIDDTIKKNFPTEQWIMEGLSKSYAAKFTLKELNELIAFFDSNQGAQILKYVRQTNMAELITGNGGKLTYTAADKAEHDKFAKTPLGQKFLTAFLKETIAYEQSRENAVRSRTPDADGYALLESANLNNLFNKFVAESYNKK